MESAARFIAENCALKGVDALIKLALAYVDIDRPDGAAECLTCVARACSKPGGGDNAAWLVPTARRPPDLFHRLRRRGVAKQRALLHPPSANREPTRTQIWPRNSIV